MPDYRSLRAAASSPAPSRPQSQPSAPSHGTSDVSVRSMRLKVLYSFDSENKTNCLARWPQPLDIRTAHLDENTEIGVIELKTCIQAIVAASPELVAALGHDYTVYAYDYSEYETPLVGQGMLSWVLASSSSTPSAPAHQSRTIVTGRVCKNLLGLFSSNAQETLEVKLRLVPVPTSLQSEYLESMKKYRDISQMMPEGFDPQAWTSFIQANPAILQLANKSRSQSPAVGSAQSGGFGIERVQRLLNGEVYQQRNVDPQNIQHTRTEPQRLPPQIVPPQNNSNYAHLDAASQLPRLPSPASSVASATTKKKRGRPPGPNPKKSRSKTTTMQASEDTGYASNDERYEDGPNRKRAKVTQAEWSGNTDFGKQPESLRVAASTAASIRMHQPTAVRPNNSLANSLEGPPREPTPIAHPSGRVQLPQLPVSGSALRRGSFAIGKKEYASPYKPVGLNVKLAESATTSPEASQAESSPVDISSSPPVYPGASTCPSSPILTGEARHFEDSGFMSGNMDDLFEDDEMRPVDDEDLDVAAQYSKRPNLSPLPDQQEPAAHLPDLNSFQQRSDFQQSNAPQRQNQQSHNPQPLNGLAQQTQQPYELPRPHQREGNALTVSGKSARGAAALSRTASSGNMALPPVPASDPIRPTLNRSQTWSGHQAPHPASDVIPVPPAIETIEKPVPRPRKGSEIGTGSGVRRKQAIQSKLASSVAAGEMPPFCENCGAIETPTWRKAWVKIHCGTPEHVVISEEEGGIIAWQGLQTDSNGTICLYRIVKKSVLKTDEGFTEILLCNPCGLWLHTRKCMRPKEVWDKTHNGLDDKKKRGSNGKRQRANSTSDQAASGATDGSTLQSNNSSSANDGGESRQTESIDAESQLPPFKHRRASSQHTISPHAKHRIAEEASAVAALERAIRSSPHKFKGTEHVSIDVEDLTPQPTRRVLFPSPTLSEGPKLNNPKISGSGKGRNQTSGTMFEISDDVQDDKENCPPPIEDDGLDHLFTEDHNNSATTPNPSSATRAHIFKTPRRSPDRPPPTTGDFFSSTAKALLHAPTTPKGTPSKDAQPLAEVTPFTAHLNQLLSDANNGSPGSKSFDFPSLPSLHNTPGRRTMDFDFSQFDSQDLLSTDVPMPSSPPAWFGVYEDPIEHGAGSLWEDYALPNSASTPPDEEETNGVKLPKTPGLIIDENGRATIDFQITS